MGFESTEIARWRLSSLVAENDTLGNALCDALAGPVDIVDSTRANSHSHPPLTALDILGRDALDSPGAGANFLSAFAAQNRALRLIWEMHERGGNTLPADVAAAVRQAMKAADTVLS